MNCKRLCVGYMFLKETLQQCISRFYFTFALRTARSPTDFSRIPTYIGRCAVRYPLSAFPSCDVFTDLDPGNCQSLRTRVWSPAKTLPKLFLVGVSAAPLTFPPHRRRKSSKWRSPPRRNKSVANTTVKPDSAEMSTLLFAGCKTRAPRNSRDVMEPLNGPDVDVFNTALHSDGRVAAIRHGNMTGDNGPLLNKSIIYDANSVRCGTGESVSVLILYQRHNELRGMPMAERSKMSDFESELEIAQVRILSVTVSLFINIIDLVLYRLSPLFCLIRSSHRPVVHEDGQNKA
ncbi:hypothetical protein J6590_037832 [Homalodisca vitripennis]|nr:hypothetical protein J6590_037832 [Homalodisca vitripennis]